MRIEYSPAAQLAVTKAAHLARQAGSVQITPLDLLRGLVDEEEGQPMLLVRGAGVGMDQLRRVLPSCGFPGEAPDDVPLAAATAGMVAHACELARLHGAEGSVTSDHLLLAVLELDLSSRALLEGIGLDFSALKDRISPPTPPLFLEKPLELGPATEAVDTARIVDASANRAREALRVLEDFARFVRGDALLSARLKELRHQLAEALAQLPASLLLRSRDTLHDVGTTITTDQELERASPHDVALANAKRLQEALRSLEEFGKVLSPELGQAVEKLRYDSYTLERALLGSAAPHAQLVEATLYVIVTEALCKASLVGTVREALAGGAQVIQLREKAWEGRKLLAQACDIREMTHAAGALFIVNDRPDIALLAEADGVHLGQDDLPVQQARRLLGTSALIGVSTHDLGQVRAAVLEGADYLGVGPIFPSRTKQFEHFPGLEFVRQAAAETALPAFVLGGVTIDNVQEVLAAGGKRVAISQAVCTADDPRAAAGKMRQLLENGVSSESP